MTNGIPPNAFSYTVLIQGLCRGRNLEDVADFCVEMLEAGHFPNVSTFTTSIDSFCKDKVVQVAESTVRRWKNYVLKANNLNQLKQLGTLKELHYPRHTPADMWICDILLKTPSPVLSLVPDMVVSLLAKVVEHLVTGETMQMTTTSEQHYRAFLSAGLLRQATYTTARLGSFRILTNKAIEANDGKVLPLYQKALYGLIAGAIRSIVGSPTDLALIRMQADATLPLEKRRHYKNVFHALYRIVAYEGGFIPMERCRAYCSEGNGIKYGNARFLRSKC
ncbi:hypothetical protein IFM89_018342 [Coptis chinensis]|uniref:Uncharacterized protein n=1 Tax=Coptis chinensis TaxID=261450 RepID=A0A835IS36_9MAGN|nr:hypothetical protein IFM89_018342 [Coptis chinensis]